MENLTKNQIWIINRMQQIMFTKEQFKAHKHLFNQNLKESSLSQYAKIKFLEINEDEEYYLIDTQTHKSNINKIKVFKDKYEIIE